MGHENALLVASAKKEEKFEKVDSKERGLGLVNMPDEDPDLVSFVLQWIYEGQGREFVSMKWQNTGMPI